MVAVLPAPETLSKPAPLNSNTYLPALDGLRAIAILLVIPHNTSVLTSYTGIFYFIGLMTNVGWIGVQLFFALSGFLITGNLLDSRNAPNYYSAFFGRRALRIFPVYFGALLFMCVLVPMLFDMPEEFLRTLRYAPIYLFFLSNWTQPFGFAVEAFPHFWSLAIEEQFYLVWPFVVHRCTPQKLLHISIGVIVAALIIRTGMVLGGVGSGPLYMFTTSRMDALAAGAALAAIARIPDLSQRFKQHANFIAGATLVLLLLGAIATRAYTGEAASTHTFGYTILAMAFAVIVALAALQPSGIFHVVWRALSSAPLRVIGRYSYAMYVFHLPLHIYIGTKLLHRFAPHVNHTIALVYMVGLILLSFALAALSYHFYESRFLALKKYFTPITPRSQTV